MMRTSSIEISGKTYCLCLSARAMSNILSKYGKMENISNKLDSDLITAFNSSIELLAILIDAGDRYCKLEGIENPPKLTFDDLLDICDIDDINKIKTAITDTFTSGSKREIEVEESKNTIAAHQN